MPRTSKVVNRALMDLLMYSFSRVEAEHLRRVRNDVREKYIALLKDEEFDDLISKSIDHKSRTLRRFEIWKGQFGDLGL